MMNYEEARIYLNGIAAKGNILGLERMRFLLKVIDDPQDQLRFLHIAGTNGKGSVMTFLEQALLCSGYHVGRYVSPSVFAYEEKYRFDNTWISREEIARYTQQICDAVNRLQQQGLPQPTIFEAETAIAFLFFRDRNCDLVLLETGMGGVGDATNVVSTTELALFSSISLDHTEYLGESPEKIAQIKAGIMRSKVPVVSDVQELSVREILCKNAFGLGTNVTFVDPNQICIHRQDVSGQVFSYRSHVQIRIALAGTFQIRNAALALEAVDQLRKMGYVLPEESVKKGFASARWDGRFQILPREDASHPWVVLDGAHNPAAARQFVESLQTFFPGKKYVYIFGVFADKDYREIIRITAPCAHRIYTVETPHVRRALPAGDLTRALQESGMLSKTCEVITSGDPGEALEQAKKEAGEDTVIAAFGSLSFLSFLSKAKQVKECIQ